LPNRDQPRDTLFKLALEDPKDVALEMRTILPSALADPLDLDSLERQPRGRGRYFPRPVAFLGVLKREKATRCR
jgi:hypothetical protein